MGLQAVQLHASTDKKDPAAAATKLLQSCPTLCDPIDCSPPGPLCPWDFPGKSTGVGSLSLLLTF